MGVVVGQGAWGRWLEVSQDFKIRIRGPADPFVEAMARTTDRRRRLFLATRALRRDEYCIEASVEIASHCADPELRLCHLYHAVECGEEFWGEGTGWTDLSDHPGAMPWLRAVNALGDAAAQIRDWETAAECYARVNSLLPHNQMGAREKLAALPDPSEP